MGGANAASARQNQSSYGEQSASSFNNNDSFAYGGSTNMARTDSGTFVDPIQAAARQSMFADALGAANPAQAGRVGRSSVGQTLPGLQSDFNALGALSDPVAAAQSQKAALQSGLGHMFNTQLNPAIEGNAVGAGGFGGGRQGVAQGVALGEVMNSYTQGAADIDAAAQARAMQAGQLRSQLAGNMFDLRQGGQNAGLNQLSLLSQIFGPATVLSRSQARSRGSQYNQATSTGRARSTSSGVQESSGQQRSTKAGFNIFGIGG